MREYVPFLHALLWPFTYAILPDPFADFIWSLPVVFHASLKAIAGTLLGLWLLQIAKEMSLGDRAPERGVQAAR